MSNTNKQTFKNRLEILMADCGERQPYAWAKKMGIKVGLFSYYWNKGNVPTFETLMKIQSYTGCSLDWLLMGQKVAANERFSYLNFEKSEKDTGKNEMALLKNYHMLKAIHQKPEKFKKVEAIGEILKAFSLKEGS